jgi:hypothetical protein
MVEVLRRLFGSSQDAVRRQQLVDEIRGFRALKSNWNSYGAEPNDISEATIKAALDIVDIVYRRHGPLPSAAPAAGGALALTWAIGDTEAQLLIDDESYDYSVARRGHPKVIDHGSVAAGDVERRFLNRHVVPVAS